MAADAVVEVEAKLTGQMLDGLKAIQHEMFKLEKTTSESSKGMKKELDALNKKAEEQKTAFGGAASSILKWAGGLTAGILSVRAFVGVVSNSITEAQQAREAQLDLAATLKSTGHAAGVTQVELNKMAESLSLVTNFEDDAITKSQAMLLTFTKIGREVFPEATEATLNLAQKFKTDASQAAVQLGKALNDPIQGVTALRRVGISFTEQQLAQIKAMQQSGDILSAQKMILAELAVEFGGLAKASADPLKQFQNQLGEVQEDLGTALLPALTDVTNMITEMINEGKKTGELQLAFSAIGDAAKIAAEAISGVGKALAFLNRMEVRSGGTGFESVESTKALKSSLEEIKRLKQEISKPESQTTMITNQFGARVRQSDDLARQLATAKANVEKIAGTVAAPGILAHLDRNISALEARVQKLQKEPDRSATDLHKPGKTFTTIDPEALKREEAFQDALLETRKKTQEESLKYHEELIKKVREAHQREQKEALEARRALEDARAGDDELEKLALRQSRELDAIAGNESAITTLKESHALQRDQLEEELSKKSLEREKELAAQKLTAMGGFLGGLAALTRQANMRDKEARLRHKSIAIAEATVNTYLAATKALASAPPPFNYIAMAGVIAAGLAQVNQIKEQKFASGTLNAPGGMAWVGERGPELMEVPRGSRIYNNTESRAMGVGGFTHQGDVNINLVIPPGTSPSQAQVLGASAGRGYYEELKRFKKMQRDVVNLNIPES